MAEKKKNADVDVAEIQSVRIKHWLCPLCAHPVLDKQYFVHCTHCSFQITNGIWDTENGWCMERMKP